MFFNHPDGFLLCQPVHIVRIFDFVQQVDDFLGSERHAQTDGRTAPRLREGLQDNQVRELVELLQKRRLVGEIRIRLVHDDQSFELSEQGQNLFPAQVVARRVVGRAEENQFGVLVGSRQQVGSLELEIRVELHLAVLHVVDIGTDLIHAVGRLDGHHVVDARTAERPERKVDGLVAAVAQEDMLGRYLLDTPDQSLQFPLQRSGYRLLGVL